VGSVATLVQLLGMIYRYGEDPAFPEELREVVERCAVEYGYQCDAQCGDAESGAILLHAAEILSGQLYPERTFDRAACDGRAQREKGEQAALAWLMERGAKGFKAWHAPASLERVLIALSHLAELAEG